jgi:hypothetical protein
VPLVPPDAFDELEDPQAAIAVASAAAVRTMMRARRALAAANGRLDTRYSDRLGVSRAL